MGNRRSAVVMSYKNILIFGWQYSGTNSPYNPKLSRSVAAYIAVWRDLTRYSYCQKFSFYVPTKLACRACWNVNFQCRAQSTLSMCCSKSIQPIYTKFSKYQHKYVIDALAKSHKNRANLVYLFFCLRKTAITFGQECIYLHEFSFWSHGSFYHNLRHLFFFSHWYGNSDPELTSNHCVLSQYHPLPRN